ncbi:MAG: hypothetical protein RL434_2901 [Pseudomonadota bacterium]|jgi:type IV pilus modification protein PilV
MNRPDAGITLVEVMVTVAIISATLMGMAALQVVALRSTNGSVYRTQAALLADDIAERMRGNPEAVRTGAFADIDSRTFNCAVAPAVSCAPWHQASTNTPGDSCTAEDLAAFDLSEWLCGDLRGTATAKGGVLNTLPGARAEVACDTAPCAADSTHTITLEWSVPNPERHSEPAEIQRLALRIQP